MKKIYFIIFTIILNLNSKVFAANADTWIFWNCKTKTEIRNGDVDITTIPCVIDGLIDLFMWMAWTIAIVFIIIGAYQMLFWSLAKDNSKWKSTIIYAISGFVLASFSWLIIKFVLDNFGA
jgi:hypothetical protein